MRKRTYLRGMADEITGFQGLYFDEGNTFNVSFHMKGHYRRQYVILGRKLNIVSLSLREYAARLSVNDNNRKYIQKYFNSEFKQ